MEETVKLAKEGVEKGHGGPFASIVVKDGKVVGKSSNMVFATNDPTAHAEVMAIRDASKNLGTAELNGCEIYSLGEPCPMCMAAIYWARIEKVYYANTKEQAAKVGFDDSFIYKELSKPTGERVMSMQHLPLEEASSLFREWDREVDKTDLPQT
ncbi:MAG: nucleoside deaminase [Sphingobacteriales bacterium]|nr:MAG: nucleoside deaminase [Sphingobacteriales bacterium]